VTPRFCSSFVRFALKVCVTPPVARPAVPGVTDMIGGGGASEIIAPADFEESAMDVAVNMIVPVGIALGAVYVTAPPDMLDVGDMVPQALPVQLEPDSVQFTPLLAESFCSVAANVCVVPTTTFAIDGATTTEIADEPEFVSVIDAFADLVASATAVAVSVTVGGFGIEAGAVYITVAPDAAVAPESVPHAAPMQPAPDSVHDVPLSFGSFVTVAVKPVA
jgi:hypothetical protein